MEKLEITDADARSWWEQNFDEASTVSNKLLADRAAQEFKDIDASTIRSVVNFLIDTNWDNEVTRTDFACFMARFGPFLDAQNKEHNPFARAAANFLNDSNEPFQWFYGRTDEDSVTTHLRAQSNTYVIKTVDKHPTNFVLSLSKTKAGRLVLKNILIVNSYPCWTIAGATDGREFVTIDQLLRENGDCLFAAPSRPYVPKEEEKSDGSAYGSVGGSAYAEVGGGSGAYANVGGGSTDSSSTYANVGGGAYADVSGGSSTYANVGGGAYADVSGGGGGAYADVSGGGAYADVSGGGAYADVSGGGAYADVSGGGAYADVSGVAKKK